MDLKEKRMIKEKTLIVMDNKFLQTFMEAYSVSTSFHWFSYIENPSFTFFGDVPFKGHQFPKVVFALILVWMYSSGIVWHRHNWFE